MERIAHLPLSRSKDLDREGVRIAFFHFFIEIFSRSIDTFRSPQERTGRVISISPRKDTDISSGMRMAMVVKRCDVSSHVHPTRLWRTPAHRRARNGRFGRGKTWNTGRLRARTASRPPKKRSVDAPQAFSSPKPGKTSKCARTKASRGDPWRKETPADAMETCMHQSAAHHRHRYRVLQPILRGAVPQAPRPHGAFARKGKDETAKDPNQGDGGCASVGRRRRSGSDRTCACRSSPAVPCSWPAKWRRHPGTSST